MRPLKRTAAAALALALVWGAAPAYAVSPATPAGTEVTTARPPVIYGYQEGMAQAWDPESGKWGFANTAGQVTIPPQYDSVVSFSLGLATVELEGKLGVIRPDGKYLIRPEYDSLLPLNCGLYIAQKGGRWGVASVVGFRNEDGLWTNQAVPLTYQKVEKGSSGGLDALILTPDTGANIIVPMFQLPHHVARLGIEGSQFPLDLSRKSDFRDVSPRDWFSLWVDLASNTGLMGGRGARQFDPMERVTVAEAIQIAANMDSRFLGDDFHLTPNTGSPWYQRAVNYCLAHGVIRQGQFTQTDLERAATRRELAVIFDATALARSLTVRNSLNRIRSAVSDVTESDAGAASIWDLYAKGIFNGKDAELSFHPDDPVSRAEAAALAARLVRPEQRLELFR